MKHLFYMALAAATLSLVACDDGDGIIMTSTEVVSFEATENLRAVDNSVVNLTDAVVDGAWAGGTFHNVFWFEHIKNYQSQLKPGLYGDEYDGPLFYALPNMSLMFGMYYSTGQYGDSWGGFVLTRNYTQQDITEGYPQFHVWAPRGANSSATCAIGFDSSSASAKYARPTIELYAGPNGSCKVQSCYLANTELTYTYQSSVADYYYRIRIEGYYGNNLTGSVVCSLVNGTERVSDWVLVDLTSLGEVDKLVFTPESNDKSEWGINAPTYFALDDLRFTYTLYSEPKE